MTRKKLIILISFLVIAVVIFLPIIINARNYINSTKTNDINKEDFDSVILPAAYNTGINYDIKGFEKDDCIYLFLPCRADATDLVLFALDKEGNCLNKYRNNFLTTPLVIADHQIICMMSSIPSIEISTDDTYATMDEVEGDELHETKAYGDMVLSVSDADNSSFGWDKVFKSKNGTTKTPHSLSIKGRGQSSWLEDKKPFLINLEEDTSLLSMPKGDKWVLLANTVDHTLLRNEVLLNFAKDIGIQYTPGIQNVDLFINGEYRGCYSLCSKIEISHSRVNINKKKDYFYRWGIESGEYRELIPTPLWDEDNFVELINPHDDNDEAFNIAQNIITEFSEGDYEKIKRDIDIDSYVNYYWLSEISKNTDASIRSVYSYYDHKDKKMYMIAPWDYDRTIGTVEPFGKEADYLLPTGYCAISDKWLGMLMNCDEFKKEAAKAYHDRISQHLNNSIEQLDARISRIYPSACMNFTRWDYLERPLTEYSNKIAYYMGDSSYESEVAWLKEWLKQRKEWLDLNVS